MNEDGNMVLAYIVCKDSLEAMGIGRHLLQRHLVACVNIFPIQSAYWWEGEIVEDNEAVLIAKTVDGKFDAVKREVLDLHSYSVPCILKLPVMAVEETYLTWLRGEVK